VSVGSEAPRRRPWLAFLPLLVFVALCAVFLLQLFSGREISEIPSELIGQPAPQSKIEPLAGTGLPGIDPATFKGKVTVLNVWASWCAPCREEHPLLLAMAADKRFNLIGLNWKDQPEKAAQFLARFGNPYSAIGIDPYNRIGVDWGVYGAPETFVIGRDGKITFKYVGPLSDETMRSRLLPEVEKALAAPSS